MNNYVYIVASLPDIAAGWKFADKTPSEILEEILSLCSEKDRETVQFLQDGLDGKSLDREFYLGALSHKEKFIREYFCFDLNLRNAKVRYLNKALGREADRDILTLTDNRDGEEMGFEEASKVEGALNAGDILSRERSLDDLTWEKIDSLISFHYFDLDVILGFIAKMHIVARWYHLDEAEGRARFEKLVNEVRGTFKGVEFNA
ncbi:MAG: DUF2764 family protein [Candidatus Cryptobacteroides sp.]